MIKKVFSNKKVPKYLELSGRLRIFAAEKIVLRLVCATIVTKIEDYGL